MQCMNLLDFHRRNKTASFLIPAEPVANGTHFFFLTEKMEIFPDADAPQEGNTFLSSIISGLKTLLPSWKNGQKAASTLEFNFPPRACTFINEKKGGKEEQGHTGHA